ncbi:MAG: metal-dependent hydrolase [Saprospiraceae bacterium]|nr:metal-dependent hydrolase [Saprospiraceae bacterium]
MKITYFGHSCFLVETTDKRILFDPFISGNPLASSVKIDDIRCDYILLSHGHSDHCIDLERIARNNPDVIIVGIWEIHAKYSEMGFNTHPMNKGGWWSFDFGRVKMVNAVHSSSWPDGTYAGSPAGFVLDTPDGVLYFAGDTALTMDMQLIPMTCPKLDVAILPVGSNFTMDFQDAILASDFIQCNQIIGCHFDTFGFVVVNHEEGIRAFNAKGKQLFLPKIGETLDGWR